MKVYEITLKAFLLENIVFEESLGKIAHFIDSVLSKEIKFLNLHNENRFKSYCFNSFYPIEKDMIYKRENIYTIKIRSINKELATYLNENLKDGCTEGIKGLISDIRIIPKKHIEKIYTITPIIIKTDNGYWRGNLSFEAFEKRIKENLIKKYNYVFNTKLDEDFELYNSIEITNKKPIANLYKGKKLLGDKISLNISDNELAQNLAYLSLGCGVSEINSRGYGYVNYRYL